MKLFDLFREHLNMPEYMHVLINPVPVYGLSMGVLALIIALIWRSRRARIISLALIFVAAAAAYPTYEYGEQGYDRVKSMSDSLGEKWIDAHKARAEKLIKVFYLLAAVAVAAMLVPIQWPKTALPLALLTLLLAIGTLGAGGYIAFAGGQVRHKEFRNGDPPPESQQPTHENS